MTLDLILFFVNPCPSPWNTTYCTGTLLFLTAATMSSDSAFTTRGSFAPRSLAGHDGADGSLRTQRAAAIAKLFKVAAVGRRARVLKRDRR